MLPKVSIIVPVYNVAKYIERCAISLFEQSLEDIEYIFVNDCTPDDSMRILADVIARYPQRRSQIHIYNLTTNQGLPNARRVGISLAKGEYIAHCDSDDWVDKDMYYTMYRTAVEGNYDVVRCNFVRSYPFGDKQCCQIPDTHYNDKLILISDLIRGTDLSAMWDKLVKRELYEQNNIIYPVANMLEDYPVVLQLLYYSNKIGYVNKVLYYYYYNSASITNTLSNEQVINRYYQQRANVGIMIDFLDNKGLLSKMPEDILILKFRVLDEIRTKVHIPKFYRIWKTAYPELTIWSIPGCIRKIKHVITALCLYPLLYNIKKIVKEVHARI